MYVEESARDSSVLLGYCDNRYSVHSGLSLGANYTVVVQAHSSAPTTVDKEIVSIAKQALNGKLAVLFSLSIICI